MVGVWEKDSAGRTRTSNLTSKQKTQMRWKIGRRESTGTVREERGRTV